MKRMLAAWTRRRACARLFSLRPSSGLHLPERDGSFAECTNDAPPVEKRHQNGNDERQRGFGVENVVALGRGEKPTHGKAPRKKHPCPFGPSAQSLFSRQQPVLCV